MSYFGRVWSETQQFSMAARQARIAGAALVLASFAGLGGCATSVQPLSDAGVSEAAVAERVALIDAAAAVRETIKWPEPSKTSWLARLSGRGGAEEPVTRDTALDAYIDDLTGRGDPVRALVADVETTLGAADGVILAAERALEAVSPRMSDVAVLETTIKELRDYRSMYLSALRRLETPDETSRRTSAALKAGFDRAVRQIGGLADALADRAAERQMSYAAAKPTAS